MSISVLDLKPGDRVVLNCPKAHGDKKREARFDGVYNSMDDLRAALLEQGSDFLVDLPGTAGFIAKEKKSRWARFLMQTTVGVGRCRYPGGGDIKLPAFGGVTELTATFVVDADGGLREEEGRRVFIERRVRVGQG